MTEDDKKLFGTIAEEDAAGLKKAAESYGNSWKTRGGVGAFMMLARKFDRMEVRVEVGLAENEGTSFIQLIIDDTRGEGLIDDVRDLRRYLVLVEAEVIRLQHNNTDENGHLNYLGQVSQECAELLLERGSTYEMAGLWEFLKKDWKNLEMAVKDQPYVYDVIGCYPTVFAICQRLCQYLMLAEAKVRSRGYNPNHRDNVVLTELTMEEAKKFVARMFKNTPELRQEYVDNLSFYLRTCADGHNLSAKESTDELADAILKLIIEP